MMGLPSMSLGPILMILFWVLVVTAALWLVSRLFPQTSGQPSPPANDERKPPPSSPLEILKQRYARGEITKSEYLETRNTLRN
jgi:putative membrane protein